MENRQTFDPMTSLCPMIPGNGPPLRRARGLPTIMTHTHDKPLSCGTSLLWSIIQATDDLRVRAETSWWATEIRTGRTMRNYYSGDKKRREDAKRKKAEAKRLKRLKKHAGEGEPEASPDKTGTEPASNQEASGHD